MHPLGLAPLDARELLHVRADLEQRRGLDVAGELGVHDLVAPLAEVAGTLDPDQEVRAAEPAAVEERGLVDDVVAASHGLDRRRAARHSFASRSAGRSIVRAGVDAG